MNRRLQRCNSWLVWVAMCLPTLAQAEEHWAFQAPSRPSLPPIARAAWARNPIDTFISSHHERQGLKPQPEAKRLLLLRRLYLDLIGVPPGPDEVARVEAAPDESWYEGVVQQLLADPRHGERWARHWMDVWRYSDWWGLGDQLRNSQKHIWHWRDWIVESLNANLPYDEMVRLMLAADESHPDDLDKLRATGFLARNWYLFNRHQWLEETVEHVSKGFLGLTVNCAKCHDHKFDPVSQMDFYRMRAVFEPYQVRNDMLPGVTDIDVDSIPRAFDGWLDKPTYRFVRGEETKPDQSVVAQPGIPDFLTPPMPTVEPIMLTASAWQPARRPWVQESMMEAARQKVQKASLELAATHEKPAGVESPMPEAQAALKVAESLVTLAQTELESLQKRISASRAQWDREDRKQATPCDEIAVAVQAERRASVAKSTHQVAEAELRVLRAEPGKKDEMEKQLAAARESLTKAVAVSESEVKAGEIFTRIEGARWAATRFDDSTKDDAPVAFPAESSGRRTALAAWITDPRNPLTARVAVNQIWMHHLGTPLVATVFDFGRKGTPPTHPELLDWLATELITSGWNMKHLHELIVTSATYRMSSTMVGGEANAVKDPDNLRWWRRNPIRLDAEVVRDSALALTGELDATRGGPPIAAAAQAESKRRSLYFFHSNNDRNLFLTSFDTAMVKECYRREQSIVPQQALALTNGRLVLDASWKIADRFSTEVSADADFINLAFSVLLGFKPGDAEMKASLEALGAWSALPPDEGRDAASTARSHLIWSLLNHNDFVTLR